MSSVERAHPVVHRPLGPAVARERDARRKAHSTHGPRLIRFAADGFDADSTPVGRSDIGSADPVANAIASDELLANQLEVIPASAKKTDEPAFSLRLAYVGDSHSNYSHAAKAATILKKAEQQFPNLIVIHSGDALVGTPLLNVGGRGKAEMDIIEEMGVQIYVPGNHDLDNGAAFLAHCLKESPAMKVLVANWKVTGGLAKRVQPYTIREVNGHRVAIIGLSADPAVYGDHIPELTFREPAEVLKELLPKLREKEHPDAIIVASHLGLPVDEDLAGRFPEVNAWVGGHSHSVLSHPEPHSHPDASVNYIVHAGKNFDYVGLLKLGIRDHRAVSASGGLLGIQKRSIPPDPRVGAILARYQTKLASYREVIAVATREISRNGRHGPDSPLGNLVADFIRDRAAREVGPVDIGFINRTGLRASIPKGPITAETMQELFPFDSDLCVTELTGRQIQAMLDYTASAWNGNPISGVTYTIDNGHATDVLINGKPLDPDRTYRVASVDYLIEQGGDGYSVCTQGKNAVNIGVDLRSALIDYLRGLGEVDVGKKVELRTKTLDVDLDTTIGKMLE